MDVALIRWPDEQARRTELAAREMPRLLLLQTGDEPPLCLDLLEDWVRVPAAPEDVKARADNLVARFESRNPVHISLDATGMLHFGGRRTRLTPLQARLVALLIERPGVVVTRADMVRAGWEDEDEEAKANALEAHLVRLRRLIEPLGLRIRTVRSRGYLVEEPDCPQQSQDWFSCLSDSCQEIVRVR